MSSALAIAAVTAVLRDLLTNGLIDHDVSSSVGDVSVTALAPDRISLGNDEKSQLNLFMYQATPNQGWRNEGLPSRDTRGQRVSNPPLGLDLHYLVTAYGARDFHSDILLGYAMQLLHETPVLPREAIRRALAPPTPVSAGGSLPAGMRQLATSGLADQIEQIKITPQPMNTEETSKLWSALQAHYRPTAAYLASVVLIESTESTRSSLPVRGANLYALPFRQIVVEQVTAEGGADQPIVDGSRVVLRGRGLRGEVTTVRVGSTNITPASEDVSDTEVRVTLPSGLPAGVQGAQVSHPLRIGTPLKEHRGAESNLAAFVLRPTVDAVQATNVTGAGTNPRAGNLRLDLRPTVGASQRVTVLLNELLAPGTTGVEPVSYSFVADPRTADAATIVIPFDGVKASTYLVRVQVDGAESPLVVESDDTKPMFGRYIGPAVTIP